MNITIKLFTAALALGLTPGFAAPLLGAETPPPSSNATAPEIPLGRELTDAILQQDLELFSLMFDRCDPVALAARVVDDLEFYHDLGGQVANSAREFIDGYGKRCVKWSEPNAWRSRREQLIDKMQVFPIAKYGAVHIGEHYFYERRGDGPDKRVGHARFVNLWKYDSGTWKLARVISYDHKPATDPDARK